MNYKNLAEEIVKLVDGEEEILLLLYIVQLD